MMMRNVKSGVEQDVRVGGGFPDIAGWDTQGWVPLDVQPEPTEPASPIEVYAMGLGVAVDDLTPEQMTEFEGLEAQPDGAVEDS